MLRNLHSMYFFYYFIRQTFKINITRHFRSVFSKFKSPMGFLALVNCFHKHFLRFGSSSWMFLVELYFLMPQGWLQFSNWLHWKMPVDNNTSFQYLVIIRDKALGCQYSINNIPWSLVPLALLMANFDWATKYIWRACNWWHRCQWRVEPIGSTKIAH